MITMEFQDLYNKDKVWIVKKSKCNHYYLNQKIKGRKINRRFIRTTKKHIEDIGIFQMKKIS